MTSLSIIIPTSSTISSYSSSASSHTHDPIKSSLDSSSLQSPSIKQVAFSPLAIKIPNSEWHDGVFNDENEDDEEEGGRRGRFSRGRSYSLDPPTSLSLKSTKSTLSKFLTSLSTTLQPLLSPPANSNGSGSVGGVCTFSGKSLFDLEEGNCSSSKEYETIEGVTVEEAEEGGEEEVREEGKKFRLRLPSLSRIRSPTISTTTTTTSSILPPLAGSPTSVLLAQAGGIRSQSLDSTTRCTLPLKSILKSPSDSKNGSIPLPTISDNQDQSLTTPSSATSALLPNPNPPTDQESTITIPLLQCCKKCLIATKFGQSEEWKEKFSKGARNKRKNELDFVCTSSKELVEEGNGVEEKKWETVLVDELLPRVKEKDCDLVDTTTTTTTTIPEDLDPLTYQPINSTSTTTISPTSPPPPLIPPPLLSEPKSKSKPDLYIPPLIISNEKFPSTTTVTTSTISKRRFSLSGMIDLSIGHFAGAGGGGGGGGRNYA